MMHPLAEQALRDIKLEMGIRDKDSNIVDARKDFEEKIIRDEQLKLYDTL